MARSRLPAALAAACVTAGLVLAGGTLASSASADPTTTAPSAGSLSIRAVSTAVRPGRDAVIDGDLAAPHASVAGKTVTLQAATPGSATWTAVATATTRDFGGVSATVPVSGTTRFRWVFAGDSSVTAATSGVVQVHLSTRAPSGNRLPSSLSVRVRYPQHAASAATVMGTLRSHGATLGREQVLLMIRRADAPWWAVTQVRRTSWDGHVAFAVDPPAGASYRLVFLGDEHVRPSESGIVRPVVHTTTTLHISGRAVPAGYAVTGRLGSQGHAVPGETVILQQQGADGTWASIGTELTNGEGRVRFVRPADPGTRYRLLFVGADSWATATSITVAQP